MDKHPINLAVRFFLEIAALFIFGVWGWQSRTDWPRYLIAVGLPLGAAALWGTFRVPGDPGEAPVAIPGLIRLFLEVMFFTAATLALIDFGSGVTAWIFGGVVILHYAVSYERIAWMLER